MANRYDAAAVEVQGFVPTGDPDIGSSTLFVPYRDAFKMMLVEIGTALCARKCCGTYLMRRYELFHSGLLRYVITGPNVRAAVSYHDKLRAMFMLL